MAKSYASTGRIAKALVLLGIITPGPEDATRDPFPLGPSDGVPDEWYAWYRAWRAIGSRGLAPCIARHYGGYILYAGRWLARRHPSVVSPRLEDRSVPFVDDTRGYTSSEKLRRQHEARRAGAHDQYLTIRGVDVHGSDSAPNGMSEPSEKVRSGYVFLGRRLASYAQAASSVRVVNERLVRM
jgi:hypothetical protein